MDYQQGSTVVARGTIFNILWWTIIEKNIYIIYIYICICICNICTHIFNIVNQLSVQFSSVTQSCPTLCDPMNRSAPGLPVHHQLPEFTQTHFLRVGDVIQPSHPLLSPLPPAPNPSQHQSLLQWVNSSHEVAKVLEFQLLHHSFQRTPRADLLQNGLVGYHFLIILPYFILIYELEVIYICCVCMVEIHTDI